jgi:hypothetical protein
MSRYQSGLRWGVPLLVAAAVVVIISARAGNTQSIATVGQGGFAATAFQVNLHLTMGAGAPSATVSAAVPAGRRFVIERVGITGTQPSGQAVYYNLQTTVNGTQSTYPQTEVFLGRSNNLSLNQVGYNREMDGLYAEGPLRFNVTRATTSGQVNVTMAVAGHLEP